MAFLVEEFMKRMNTLNEAAARPPSVRPRQPHERSGTRLNKLKEEQEASIHQTLSFCEEMMSRMVKYRTNLVDFGKEHKKLINKLSDVIKLHIKLYESLEEGLGTVDKVHEEGRQEQQQLKSIVETLTSAKTTEDLMTALEKADDCQDVADHWIKKCQEMFPDVKTIHKSIKVGI